MSVPGNSAVKSTAKVLLRLTINKIGGKAVRCHYGDIWQECAERAEYYSHGKAYREFNAL